MKEVRQILAAYRKNENYTIEEAEKELLDLSSVINCLFEEVDAPEWIKRSNTREQLSTYFEELKEKHGSLLLGLFIAIENDLEK